MVRRLIVLLVCLSFILGNLQYAYALPGTAAGGGFSINQLPAPGAMVGVSAKFAPVALKGLVVDPQKPLELRFIVDTGSDAAYAQAPATQQPVRAQIDRLVKYFLAGLTIPDGDLWVNLSPYEKDRIVPKTLGQTGLGRDLLAQDYILKQLTASLIYPERKLGEEFWSRVYAKAEKLFGTTNVPVNTFNKVWILPKEAQVFEHGNAVYVTKATLKVMLDEDYLALKNHRAVTNPSAGISSRIMRKIVLPEIEKEVNEGKNFAPLRQIYQALILAKWYKQTVQNGLLDAVYTDRRKTMGINLLDPAVKEQIYRRYLQAYKKGVFDYVKEVPARDGRAVPRKYFSGGTSFSGIKLETNGTAAQERPDGAMISATVDLEKAPDLAMASTNEKILDLINDLKSHGVVPAIPGKDLSVYDNPAKLVNYIRQHGIIENPDDIARVLSWRLQVQEGHPPLSGISGQSVLFLYDSLFAPDFSLAMDRIRKAGFVVSGGNLIPKANEQQDKERANLGLFNQDPRVIALIKELQQPEEWDNIVQRGAFVFDVDKTLLPRGSKGLKEYARLASLFAGLMRAGVRVVIISGNSWSEQMKRIYLPIEAQMAPGESLTFYVNEGAEKITIDKSRGGAVLEETYNVAHGMDAHVIQKAIDETLQEMAQDNFGLSPQQLTAFKEALEAYRQKSYETLHFEMPWENKGAWKPQWVTEEEVQREEQATATVSVPWIGERGRISRHGKEFFASLAIKPTPVFEFNGQKIDVRPVIQRHIVERLRQMGQDPDRFELRSGGSTTTDITLANADKPEALADFITANGLDPRWVFYLGDEFYVREGRYSNDEPIAREARVAGSALDGVRTLAVNENNIEGSQVAYWIGRTPQATEEFLEQVVPDTAKTGGALPAEELHKDAAAPPSAEATNGGIDLDQIHVRRYGRSVMVRFDPARLRELRRGGFEGFTPVIVNIRPLQNFLKPSLGTAGRYESDPG
ncbi:MAG: hypothetical protein KGJ95_05500 [Candidatus Omnitrophica bacterium]|nr:hypothetical protein [Candidatus Omnitrophota bacterium]